MYVYTYIYIYIYTYTCVYIYIYILLDIHIYIYIYTHNLVYSYIYIYIYIYMRDFAEEGRGFLHLIRAVILVPMPLPEKVIQTSSCTIFTFALCWGEVFHFMPHPVPCAHATYIHGCTDVRVIMPIYVRVCTQYTLSNMQCAVCSP